MTCERAISAPFLGTALIRSSALPSRRWLMRLRTYSLVEGPGDFRPAPLAGASNLTYNLSSRSNPGDACWP